MSTLSTVPTVTVTVDELDRDPEGVLCAAQDTQVAIYEKDKPVAMLVPVEVWRDYLRRVEEAGGNECGAGS